MRYFQCRFRRGSERTVAWIDERGAKVGARVQLTSLDDGSAWDVETVGKPGLESAALTDLQRLNRKSLSSIMNTIV
jgi:hypothetical protein